ncbi:MAG: hypothetical protein RIQ56_407 [Candidatus Parcubacteria bacterium]|jgi:hypothetical protein
MRRYIHLLLLLVALIVPGGARAQDIQCKSCKAAQVELATPEDMINFVASPDYSLDARKKVLSHLLTLVFDKGEADLGVALAETFGLIGQDRPEAEAAALLGDNAAKLTAFVLKADVPRALVYRLQILLRDGQVTPDALRRLCGQIFAGTDSTALRGFEVGCKYGEYFDGLQARARKNANPQFITLLLESTFGRVAFTRAELRQMSQIARGGR